MIEDSFISLPKNKVIELCEKTIAHINNKREKEDNEYLNKIVSRRNNSWIRKIFKKPKIILEEIREEYKNHTGCSYDFPSTYAWGDFGAAERVLKIAKASNDVVYISSSDFGRISF